MSWALCWALGHRDEEGSVFILEDPQLIMRNRYTINYMRNVLSAAILVHILTYIFSNVILYLNTRQRMEM